MSKRPAESDQADPKKAWELFLNTVQNGEEIQVTKVTSKEITFSITNLESLANFKALLANPSELQARVLHAIGKSPHQSSSSNVQPVQKIKVLSPKELMHTIFSKDFLTDVGVTEDTLDRFQDNPTLQTATLTLTGTQLEMKRDLIELEILQSTIDQKANLSRVLKGDEPFHEQTNNTPEFAGAVLQIDPTIRTVTFNYGLLLQEAQSQLYDSAPPMIATSSTVSHEFTIDRSVLLQYLSKVIPSGLIFKQINDNGMQGQKALPILFASNDNEGSSVKPDTPHKFHILLDVSGSMKDSFDTYISSFKKIITELVSKVSNWEITISPFSSLVHHQVFSSQNKDTEKTINAFIDTLQSGGDTDLNCALSSSLNALQGVTQHSTLIIFTDGADTVRICTQQNIVDSASVVRNANDQFAMYSIGYGNDYDTGFFKTLADQGGFTHMHLSNIEQIAQYFGQYVENINTKRILYKFIVDESKQFMKQVQAGDIAVAPHSVSLGTKILQGDNEYTIGTSNPVSSSYMSFVKSFFTSAWSSVPSFHEISTSINEINPAFVMATACYYAPQIIGVVSNYCAQSLGGNDSLLIDAPQ